MQCRNITREQHVPEIEAAIEALSEREFVPAEFTDDGLETGDPRPYSDAFDGWFEYVVEEGEHPDTVKHYVDLSDIPGDMVEEAVAWLHDELARHGIVIQSVNTDPLRAHLMHETWVRRRFEGHHVPPQGQTSASEP